MKALWVAWLPLAILLRIWGPEPGQVEFFVSHGLATERVIGLLQLPEVLSEEGCGPTRPQPVSVYSTPSKERPSVGSIEARKPIIELPDPSCLVWDVIVRRVVDATQTEGLPTDESGYEAKAAVVYERKGRWYRIALQHGSAWVERESSEGFLSYPEALTPDRFLTHLRKDWDGRLWQQPGSRTNQSVPAGWQRHLNREIPISILGTRVIAGETWVRIRLLTEVCGDVLERTAPVEGWVPSHRATGATSIWFSSRGC